MEPRTDVLLERLAFAGAAARGVLFGRRSAALPLGCGPGQARTLCGDRVPHPCGQGRDPLAGTQRRRAIATNEAHRLRRQGCASGRAALERHTALLQGRVQPSQNRCAIRLGRRVGKPLLPHTLVVPLLHGREDTVWPFRACVDGSRARQCLTCPREHRAAHGLVRLLFPPPPPHAVWSHKAPRPGGRARGANWRVGRAGHRQTPPARPHRSPGGCIERRAGLQH